MATLKSIKNKYLQASDGTVLGVTTNTQNISALAFKVATADSISKFSLVDGFSDDYNDNSGVDATNSANDGRNSTNNYYSGQVDSPVTVTKNSGDVDTTIDTTNVSSLAASMWGSGGETGPSSSGGAGGYVKVTVDTSSIDSVLLRIGTPGGTDSGRGGNGPGGEAGDGGSMTGLFDGSYLRANSLAIAAGGGGGTKSVGGTGPGGDGDATGNNGGGPAGGTGGNISSFSGGAGSGGHESGGGYNEGGGGGSGYNSGSGGGGSDPSDYAGGGGGASNYTAASETTQIYNESAGDSNSTGDSNFNSSYGGANEGGRAVVTYTGTSQGNMTLISNSFTAQTEADTTRIILEEWAYKGAETLNTDLKAYASRDDGTTYTQVTLATQSYIEGVGGINGDTQLMLHMEGNQGGTTFTDTCSVGTSNTAKVWTASGDAITSTAQFKFGTSSAYFDGTGDYINTPAQSDWNFGTADFTIDFWMRPSVVDSQQRIFGDLNSGGSSSQFEFILGGSGAMSFGGSLPSGLAVVNAETFIADTWHHVALTRNSTSWRLFIDGITGTVATFSGTMGSNTTTSIGRSGAYNSQYYTGWIDEVRITPGVALWTANFTVPNQASELGKRLLSGSVDISGQPAGTLMKYKLTTHNQATTLDTRVYATSMAWA